MTPNDIEILIHCHCSATVHPRIDAPAVKDSLKWMVEEGLIETAHTDAWNKTIYHTTERGQALIMMLCHTPLPEQAWVDGSGKVIEF